jgi:ferredoxin
MRVVVDHDLCEGHGKCELSAPEVFALGDDDRSHVRIEEVGDDLRQQVEQAIRLCPRQAIRWVEERGAMA